MKIENKILIKIMLYLIGHIKVNLNNVNICIISLFFIMWALKRYQVVLISD